MSYIALQTKWMQSSAARRRMASVGQALIPSKSANGSPSSLSRNAGMDIARITTKPARIRNEGVLARSLAALNLNGAKYFCSVQARASAKAVAKAKDHQTR